MKEKDFLLEYGKEEVIFWSLYKYRVIYGNKEKGIVVSGQIENRDSLTSIETVNVIFQLEDFQFTFNK